MNLHRTPQKHYTPDALQLIADENRATRRRALEAIDARERRAALDLTATRPPFIKRLQRLISSGL